MDVQSGKKCLSVELIQDEVDSQHGIYVALSPLVYPSVILNQPVAPVFLVNIEDWACI
jgi:hypothetical protein